MEPLRVIEEQKDEEVKLYRMILDLMSYEKVVIAGMSLVYLLCVCGMRHGVVAQPVGFGRAIERPWAQSNT